jgi:threonine/homoserine/homoserine lactone efflux protein
MDTGAPLWLFFLMVLGIVALPGMDMAFVVGSSLRGGRRAGLLAVAGIMAGAIFHVTVTGLGLGALLQWIPGLFNALLVAGALYLVWIGVSIWRADFSTSSPEAAAPASTSATFRQGLFTSVMNPKAYVFVVAVFPQFMQSGDRPLALQFLFMGLIIWIVQAGVYGPIAIAAGSAGTGLQARPRLLRFIARTTACVLVIGAVVTAVEGWRPL